MNCIDSHLKWRDADGYSYIVVEGRKYRHHRYVFFQTHGYWPTICRHTCDNPGCVNPEHLIDGSITDNNRDTVNRGRNANANKTHCKQGHEFTPDNTYVYPGSYSTFRVCRACVLERARKRRERKRTSERAPAPEIW